MADVAKVGKPSLSSLLLPANDKISGLLAGEDLAAGDVCYIKNDGKVWKAIGTTTNAAARARGFAATDAKSGESVSLVNNCQMAYGSGLTPGADYYLSATAGGGKIADAASTGGVNPIAFAVDTTRIRILPLR
jgi:hypothetical protein